MRDLRKYAQQTRSRLLMGLFLLVFSLGLALIYFVYGFQAALFGLFCLVGILVPIALIYLILNLIEKFAKNE